MSTEAALISSACTVLAGVIVALWRHLWAQLKASEKLAKERNDATQAQLAACRAGDVKRNEQVLVLTEKVGRMEGYREGIMTLSQQVLDKLDEKIENT